MFVVHNLYLLYLVMNFQGCLSSLKEFETFNVINVETRVKRHLKKQVLTKEVQFNVFDRSFHLSLVSGTHVLTENFSANLINADGSKTVYFVDQSHLYSGIVKGKPTSLVNAYCVDGVWSIQIFDENETIGVDPADLLVNSKENPNGDLFVAYRSPDFKSGPGKCGLKAPSSIPEARHNVSRYIANDDVQRRKPRKSKEKVCVVHLVGDYLFFSRRCKKNYNTCFAVMIHFVQLADHIYTSSNFLDEDERAVYMGVQLGLVDLYMTPTQSKEHHSLPHFNAPDVKWDAVLMLDSINYYMSFQNKVFCHNHVMTSYPMPGHVLGFAFMSGLCLEPRRGDSLLSCGFTNSEDIRSGQVTSMKMNLVFAHELGHNLGSSHDPVDPDCAPADNQGGKYLMWDRSVDGSQRNHKKFSICSLRSIGKEVKGRGACFKDRSSNIILCGNGVVEEGEQCDAGAVGRSNDHMCCTSACTLKPGANCSDANSDCCKNCQIADKRTICLVSPDVECKNISYCNGKSLACPTPANAEDYTPCASGGGQCYKGVCKGFCEMKMLKTKTSLLPCMCEDENACKICCYSNSDSLHPGKCVNHTIGFVKDGTPCYLGVCEQNVCTSYGSRARLAFSWNEKHETSKWVSFMKTNIVASVVFLSMFLWIPVCCMISYNDKKLRKELEKVAEVLEPVMDTPIPSIHYRSEEFCMDGTSVDMLEFVYLDPKVLFTDGSVQELTAHLAEDEGIIIVNEEIS